MVDLSKPLLNMMFYRSPLLLLCRMPISLAMDLVIVNALN